MVTARLLTTPHPELPITLWTHLSPLDGLHTRAFHNIRCSTNDAKVIELAPRGWPQYRWDPEDLPAWDQLITIPPLHQGTVSTTHRVPPELIAAAKVERGENYTVKLTDLCLGTRWYAFGTSDELQGKRLRSWRSKEDEEAAAEDEAALDDETKDEMRVERQQLYGDRPAVSGEDPSSLAMVPEVGEVGFEII